MTSIFANRPLRVRLDGAPLDAVFARYAVSAFVRQALNAPALAELVFADPPRRRPDRPGLGAGLAISVDGLGRPVRGRDHRHRIRARRRPGADRAPASAGQAAPGATASAGPDPDRLSAIDLAGQMASDLGLTFQSAEHAPTRALIVQHDQNDFDLVVDLARDAGLYLLLEAGELRLISLAGEGEPIPLRMRREIIQARATAGADSLRPWTGAQLGPCPAPSRPTPGRAGAPGRRGTAGRRADGLSGPRRPDPVQSPGRRRGRGREPGPGRSRPRRGARRPAGGGGRGRRPPAPGPAGEHRGVGDLVDGRCVVTRALHRFDEARAMSSRSRPSRRPGPTAPHAGLHPGQGDRRRRSRRPGAGAGPPAGARRRRDRLDGGAAAGRRRREGRGHPARAGRRRAGAVPGRRSGRGVVLGGLYGERIAPGRPGRRAAGARAFTVRTPGGQALTLDSVDALARLETRAGGLFEFGPGGSHLRASGDLVIEAPGRRLTIRAAAVAFEEG
jgi:hypothetical protein